MRVGVGVGLVVVLAAAAVGQAGQARDEALEELLFKVMASASNPLDLRGALARAQARALARAEQLDGAAECDLDLLRWADGLRDTKTWALQMVDATSKLVTGILYGDFADLGNFDECVRSTPGTLGSGNDFTGRYALPSLKIEREESTNSTSNGTEWKSLVTLQLSLCVPSSCSASLLEAILQEVLLELDDAAASLKVRVEVTLPAKQTSVYSGWRQADSADWAVVALCAFLLALVAVATVIDLVIGNDEGPSSSRMRSKVGMLLAFSAWTNGRRLLTIPPPSDTNFTCINGIRFFSMLWVILGHRYRFAMDLPFTNKITIVEEIKDNYFITVIPSAILSVDTFFIVGGMMNTYSFLRNVNRTKSFNIIEFYIHRYVRLTPALAVMIGITATWISLLGNGPLWYDTAGSANIPCQTNWWAAMLYVANYVHPDNQCMMQAWYLMVDMQLFWLSPLVLIPIWKCRRLGILWALILTAVSCAIPFWETYVYDFRALIPLDINDAAKQTAQMDTLYYPTHMRATSYLVGLLAGVVLYDIRTGKVKRRITTLQVALGWLLSTTVCLTVIIGSQPLYNIEGAPYNQLASAFYIGFARLAWGLGICWVVLACITGHGAPVNAILSWAPLSVLGRLTYSIYLVHAAVQIVDMGTIRKSVYYSDFKMVEKMFSDACFGTLFALILCLSTESPIMTLEKEIKARGRKPRKDPPLKKSTERLPIPAPAPSAPLPSTSSEEMNGNINPAFIQDDEVHLDWQLPRVRLHSTEVI